MFCSSGWFHTFDLDQRCDVFTADKSDVAEQRGSMRFQIKKSENGIAQVSTEFNVILANRPRHHRSTSVFAQVNILHRKYTAKGNFDSIFYRVVDN